MKIIEVIPHLMSGGAEKLVVDLSNAFVKMGNETQVVTLFKPREDDLLYSQLDSEVIKTHLDKKTGNDWSTFSKLLKYIKTEKPAVVHFHIGAIKYGLLSVLLYRKCKYYATIHSEAKREAGKGIEKWVRKFMFRWKYMIPVTISPESELSFKNFYGYNTLMIPNGTASYTQNDLSELCKKYHADVDFLFVHAGRIHPVKNQKMLISAIEGLLQEGYKIRLLILGRGANDEITQFIKSHSSNNIVYLGEKQNVRDYVAISDAFCLSSLQEGLPITALESFSVGTPVVSTPVGGCVNVVINGKTGILASEVSKDAYVEALKKYMEISYEKRNIMRNVCLQEFKKKYSIDKCAERYVKVFKS